MEEQKTENTMCIEPEIFSWNLLCERFGGDEDIIKEVIPIFLKDNTERMENLEKAIAADDIKKIKFYTHSLKGAGGNIGSVRLHKIAYEMEKAADKGNSSVARDNFNELKSVFDKIVELLSREDCIEVAKQMSES